MPALPVLVDVSDEGVNLPLPPAPGMHHEDGERVPALLPDRLFPYVDMVGLLAGIARDIGGDHDR